MPIFDVRSQRSLGVFLLPATLFLGRYVDQEPYKHLCVFRRCFRAGEHDHFLTDLKKEENRENLKMVKTATTFSQNPGNMVTVASRYALSGA